MADLLVVAAPLLMLALLYCGWRGLSLLARWRPAAATVWRGDYGELEQLEDFWLKSDRATSRGWSPFDGEDRREIEEIVSFEDEAGTRHRAPIRRQVARGCRPDSVYIIWYDPADPRKATARGPWSWLGGALLAAGALAWIFTGAAALAGPAMGR